MHRPLSKGPFVLLHLMFLLGLVVEAMTAALAAGRRSMDWVGVCLLGSVTALGGGSVRDVLLGHHPLTWVAHPWYLLLTCGAALLTIPLARYMHRFKRLFLLLDAVGLVTFTVVGCNVAQSMGMPFIVVIVSGMITGCAGGVLRDMLCTTIPLLFRAELYATASVVTGIIYVGGQQAGIGHDLVMLAAMLTGLSIRMLALRFGWSMPKFVYTRD